MKTTIILDDNLEVEKKVLYAPRGYISNNIVRISFRTSEFVIEFAFNSTRIIIKIIIAVHI